MKIGRFFVAALCVSFALVLAAQAEDETPAPDESTTEQAPITTDADTQQPVTTTPAPATVPPVPQVEILNTPKESPYFEAVLQGLDKATGRISTIKAPINEAVKFGTLSITARYCYKSSPEDPPEAAAFLEITDQQPNDKPKSIFAGWMFASSPAVSAIDHAIYDISVSGCKKPRQGEVPQPPATPAEPAPVN